MNILFVNEYAGFMGGVEQNIALTVKALKERGHACHLLYSKEAKGAEEYLRMFYSTSSTLDTPKQNDYLLRLAPTVVYLHRVNSVDPFLGKSFRTVRMVHDHDLCCPRRHKYHFLTKKTCQSPAGWRCWLDLAFLEKKERKIQFKNLPKHFSNLKKNRLLDQLIVGSKAMREELLQNGFQASQVQILAPAVPAADTTPAAQETAPEILFVGQMIRGKGPDLLLRAVSQLKQDFRLTMVGQGNWLDYLKGLAEELGVSHKVNWAGWVSSEELQEHYRRARVVAVPSRWPEPFGMVGLEAMQQAKPVVAFAVGGIPDWLSDGVNGFLVKPPSIDGFRQGLERLLGDSQLAAKLGMAGYGRVSEEFSFERYIDQLEAVLAGQVRVAA